MLFKKLATGFQKALGFYIPLNCPLCGGEPFDGTPNMFCKTCLEHLPFIRKPVCPGCGAKNRARKGGALRCKYCDQPMTK